MSRAVFGSLMVGALALALALRLPGLDRRPMHHDEANQAVKFGALLETGDYRYDRNDHHGPTLYYVTLPFAWLRGQATLASLDEATLRAVPAVFGTALLLLFAGFAGGLGRPAAAAAAGLAAVSPALTYYSRFYIQESLFVFAAMAWVLALGHCVRRPRPALALWAGACAGLAYATKETSVIVLTAALAAAWIAARWTRGERAASSGASDGWKRPVILACAAVGAALLVAFVFYSSFFAHPAGLIESFRAFGVYVERGIGTGPHVQPWDYYLRLLAWSSSEGLVWSEALVLVLAAWGAIAAVRGAAQGFWPKYVALYALFTMAAFSWLRYKTPWNLLPLYAGLVLLAGVGTASLLRAARPRGIRLALAALMAAGMCHLGVQNWRANVRYPADPRNPYVYAQTMPDFLRLAARLSDLASVHEDRSAMLVKVLAGPYEQWPLPWYARRLTRVGYWTRAADAGTLAGVPVIVASQDNASSLDAALGDRYQSEFYGLRPDVMLTVYIERTLWERLLASRH